MAYIPSEKSEIEINNIDKDQFPTERLSIDPFQKFKDGNHWINYFLCGYKAILATEEKYYSKVASPKGFKVLIDSHVPPAGGVSSSSAFTVCAAVTTLHANNLNKTIPKGDLSKLCVAAERLAGTACGGMDQTISIFAELNKAKLIEFNPELRAIDVEIPNNVSLVIANSLTPSPKLLTIGTRYNKRVVECRFGLLIIALKLGKADSWDQVKFKNLYELQTELGYSYDQMLEVVATNLKRGSYSLEDIKNALNVPDLSPVLKDIPYFYEVLNQNKTFMLNERATHVFAEASRVYKYKAICSDENIPNEEMVKKLGQLMNESHFSCKVLYECSSENLDELTKLARDSGAYGSRLTGAGWGGCCVSLVEKSILSSFIDKMHTYYTKEREPGDQLWVTDDLDRYLFATQPAKGAFIYDPQYSVWL